MKGVKYDFTKFNKFLRALGDKHIVKVGILSNKSMRHATGNFSKKTGRRSVNRKQESDSDNAYIGSVHEFGQISKRIPARSFLRMPLHVKHDQILREASKGAAKLMAEGRMVVVMKRMGVAAEKAVQEAFETRGFGSWKPNRPYTVAQKGSDAPLIDTAQLRRAVSSQVAMP